jgi:hypothetical protein
VSILDDIRQQYPQYADVPDGKLAAAIRKKYYADMDPPEFYRRAGLAHLVGLDAAPASGLGSSAQNYAAGMGKSAVDLGRGLEQLSAGIGSLLPGAVGDYYSNAYQQLKQ